MTRTILCLQAGMLAVIMFASCNSNAPAGTTAKPSNDTLDVASMKKIVEDRNLIYDKAFVAGDSATVMAHFTEDARVFPTNSEQIIGKNAIAPLISQFLKFGVKAFTDETTRVIGSGEYIIEEGNYFLGGDKGATIDKGKYICVWKKESGDWKVCSNMWNTSLPPVPEKK